MTPYCTSHLRGCFLGKHITSVTNVRASVKLLQTQSPFSGRCSRHGEGRLTGRSFGESLWELSSGQPNKLGYFQRQHLIENHVCWKHGIKNTSKRFAWRGKVRLRSCYRLNMCAWVLLELAGVCLKQLNLSVLCLWHRYCHRLINRLWECFSLKNFQKEKDEHRWHGVSLCITLWILNWTVSLYACVRTQRQCYFNLTWKWNEACLSARSVL